MEMQLKTNFTSIPVDLQQAVQWLNWGQSAEQPKLPSTPTGGFQRWPENLSSFENVKLHAEANGLGIGFAFSNQAEFFGIDLDGCVEDPSNGQIEPWAYAIVLLAASYCEVSPSGTGIKIICRGHVNANLKKIVFGIAKHGDHEQQVEFKTISGYFALTGFLIPNLPAFSLRSVNPSELNSRCKIYKRVLAYLDATPPAIQGQGGDSATFTMACSLIHGFNLVPNEAAILVAGWNQTCNPPWSPSELQHKFEEADKREDRNGKPRGYLLNESKKSQSLLGVLADEVREFQLANAATVIQPESETSSYKPFPVETLPEPLAQFIAEASSAICCDPSFVALPLLSALAAAIGDSRRLNGKKEWFTPAIIWVAVIGESGTGKSPAFRAVLKYLKQHQATLRKDFTGKQKQHEEAIDIYEAELKRWKSKKLWHAGKPRPEAPAKPPYPRTTVSDATFESLVAILKDNPNGLLAEFDELAGFFGAHDKYRSGSGADAATWLSVYSGDSITVDRKGEGNTFVPAAYVSIAGNIQPGVLPLCFTSKHRLSGMMARFLMAYPPRIVKQWNKNEVSDATDRQMSQLFSFLFALKPSTNEQGDRTPQLLRLAPDAEQEYAIWYDRHNLETFAHSGSKASAYSKLEEHPLRFALVFHSVKEAMGVEQSQFVQADTIRSAISLTEWFKNESKRVYSLISFDNKKSEEEKLVQLIQRKGGVVSPRELQRSNGKKYSPVKRAEAALNELVTNGFGRWQDSSRKVFELA